MSKKKPATREEGRINRALAVAETYARPQTEEGYLLAIASLLSAYEWRVNDSEKDHTAELQTIATRLGDYMCKLPEPGAQAATDIPSLIQQPTTHFVTEIRQALAPDFLAAAQNLHARTALAPQEGQVLPSSTYNHIESFLYNAGIIQESAIATGSSTGKYLLTRALDNSPKNDQQESAILQHIDSLMANIPQVRIAQSNAQNLGTVTPLGKGPNKE